MIEVRKEDRFKLQNLFEGMHDTMILTCLQGHMGRAWTDDISEPRAALLQVGDFCIITGDPALGKTADLSGQILDLTHLDPALVVAGNEKLDDYLAHLYGDQCSKIERYSFKQRELEFDLDKLKNILDKLPKEYKLYPIDSNWYDEVLKEKWSKDFVSNFLSKEDYLNRGIGRIITENSKIISGASSYSIYDGGIEIEIDTRKEYRKQGLALIAGAALILACREKGLYPNWDAANKISVHLAEKLGYEINQPYDTYMIRKRNHKNTAAVDLNVI